MDERRWNGALARLHAWVDAHGHARVPQQYVTSDGFRLGKWVHNQRTRYRVRSQSLSGAGLIDERIAALEAVPGWTWNTRRTGSSDASVWLPSDRFDEDVAPSVTLRALRRWLAERTDTAPFSEQDVLTDDRYRALFLAEEVRASLAALVATGTVRATRATGDLLPWQEIVAAEDLDASWAFAYLDGPGRAEDAGVPAAVLEACRAAAENVALR